jgi:3-deoxy-manno-octulosonate cytidylyltransferase (CMP-KDO synthetase)
MPDIAPATVIIPTRMTSTRFPGKALANETGKTLTQHVWEAASRARCAEGVYVATDDARIVEAVEAFGGTAVLTGEHPNGTSRLAETAGILDLPPDRIVVNVQGDEPDLDADLIDACVGALVATGAEAATVASPFGAGEDPADPNIVKAIVGGLPEVDPLGATGMAMCFTRAMAPFNRDGVQPPPAPPLKHVGLYAYRRSFLERYARLTPSPLERTERLEQLRILEHGFRIAVAVREAHHHGIDTPEQYRAFVERQAPA